MAERRGSRLDTPKEQRRPLIPTPSYDRDAFGVFAEQFARYMGTARFLLWMTVFVSAGSAGTRWRRTGCASTTTPSSS